MVKSTPVVPMIHILATPRVRSPTSRLQAGWASTLWRWCARPTRVLPARLRYLAGLADGTITTTGILEDSPTGATQNFQPTRYTVDFPDGRVETFRAVTWDTN